MKTFMVLWLLVALAFVFRRLLLALTWLILYWFHHYIVANVSQITVRAMKRIDKELTRN